MSSLVIQNELQINMVLKDKVWEQDQYFNQMLMQRKKIDIYESNPWGDNDPPNYYMFFKNNQYSVMDSQKKKTVLELEGDLYPTLGTMCYATRSQNVFKVNGCKEFHFKLYGKFWKKKEALFLFQQFVDHVGQAKMKVKTFLRDLPKISIYTQKTVSIQKMIRFYYWNNLFDWYGLDENGDFKYLYDRNQGDLFTLGFEKETKDFTEVLNFSYL